MNMTLQIAEGHNHTYYHVEDAIEDIKLSNFQREITLYDSVDKKLYEKVKEIYHFIKEYNQDKPLKNQLLPTNPFYFRGILGCLGVQCCSIDVGNYEENINKIALFTGWNTTVLHKV